ncbi:MAG: class II aldolase/adducin family protein [Chloroflexi bacterium]|nr:class II aldolase/adducin family protein [Chloroflexota bacterium]
MSRWEAQRSELWHVVQQMVAGGLVAGASGNASMCLERNAEQGLIMITPSQRPYVHMAADDLLVVDFEGDPVEGELMPSTETLTHVAVYRARKDVHAVIHTHSPYASVLAVAGLELPPILDELVVLVGGPVRIAKYGFPGSDDLAREACLALGDHKAVLLKNHGLLGVGATAQEALQVCELVERAAHVFVMSSLLGKASLLPQEIVDAERSLFLMRLDQPLGDQGPNQEITR